MKRFLSSRPGVGELEEAKQQCIKGTSNSATSIEYLTYWRRWDELSFCGLSR
jgi:hypothetical protein